MFDLVSAARTLLFVVAIVSFFAVPDELQKAHRELFFAIPFVAIVCIAALEAMHHAVISSRWKGATIAGAAISGEFPYGEVRRGSIVFSHLRELGAKGGVTHSEHYVARVPAFFTVEPVTQPRLRRLTGKPELETDVTDAPLRALLTQLVRQRLDVRVVGEVLSAQGVTIAGPERVARVMNLIDQIVARAEAVAPAATRLTEGARSPSEPAAPHRVH